MASDSRLASRLASGGITPGTLRTEMFDWQGSKVGGQGSGVRGRGLSGLNIDRRMKTFNGGLANGRRDGTLPGSAF